MAGQAKAPDSRPGFTPSLNVQGEVVQLLRAAGAATSAVPELAVVRAYVAGTLVPARVKRTSKSAPVSNTIGSRRRCRLIRNISSFLLLEGKYLPSLHVFPNNDPAT